MATLEAVDYDPFAPKAASTKPSSPLDTALASEGVDGPVADIARSIYQQESGSGKNTKTSNAGAVGGMQVIPATFSRMADQGWDINNPEHNARAGVRYIKTLHERAGGDPALTAAGYYGGEGAIDKARNGIAVSDPRNPKAPNTLQYGEQVVSRLPKQSAKPGPSLEPVDYDPFAGKPAAPQVASTQTPMRMESIVQGLRDPIDGGAQLLTKALPDSVVKAGNAANNWLADKTGLVGKLPEGGVDQQVRENEQAYQQRRAQNGQTGFDGYRTIGSIANPVNYIPAAAGVRATSLIGKMGTAAVAGGTAGALAPVTSGDFAGEKIKQVAIGAGAGAALTPAAGAIARLISPNASTNSQVALLKDAGVKPTIGQTLGGRWNTLEEKAQSMPIVGDAIASARRGAAGDLNRAAFNRALEPIGQTLPKGVAGRDAVNFVENALSTGYNKLLPSLTVKADQPFSSGLSSLRQMVDKGAMDPQAAKAFNRILDNDVMSKFRGQQALTGETFKQVESDLGQHIARLGASTDADQRLVGDALKQVQKEMRDMLVRSNPAKAAELKALNTAWANFKRPQRAAAALGAEEGTFSAAQLQSAVKALDKSKDKARFAEGNALMQDLSEAGKAVLGNKVPDSGTAGRVMWGAIGASGLAGPAIPLTTIAGLTAGAAAYTGPIQSALRAAVSARPKAAQPVAKTIREVAPFFAPVAGQVGLASTKE